MAIAATGDTNLARATGRWAAREARLVGINQIYAPVADVSSDPQNPVVNTRSFGEDPQRVGELVAAFVQGVEAEHVLATAKHFPGHGNTRTNSHSALPVIDVSREQLASVELPPFRAAIAAGVSAVMMAHIALPRLEPTGVPASLSRSITTGLLRDELGFRGLIVTDALDMGGVTKGFGPGEAAVRAIEAGADQILKSSDTDAAIAAVKGALRSGRLTEAQIDAAARHVLDAKRKTRFSVSSPDEIVQQLDAGEARAISQDIASRAVTLVREQANQLPLRREQHVVHVRVADAPESLRALDAELTGRLSVPPMSVSVNSTTPLGDVVTATAGADVVLFSYSVETVPPVARELADRLAQQGTPMISVCFGSPYLDVPPAGTYLLAYGSQPVMQIAVARALFGAAPVRGHLPVSIPGPYPVGHGLTK
jgi:beta-glucosidase-like glycosyl hydrolase